MSNKNGFTLIEVIVSMVLIGILIVMAGMGLVQITEGYVFAKKNGETVQKVQVAMARIVKELSSDDNATFITFQPQSVNYTRLDPSGPLVTNTIALSGSAIKITGTSPAFAATVLINNVTAFQLDYFNAAGGAPATQADIRMINITLSVTGADNQQLTFGNSVSIREFQ